MNARNTAFERPNTDHSYLTSDNRFRIHYNTEGAGAVNPTSSIQPGVPDWIIETERALSRSWHLLVDSLGFIPPLRDTVNYVGDPPEGAWDLYFVDWSYYGMTYWESPAESGSGLHSYSGFIKLDNDYSESAYFNSLGLDGLRVSVAHELFHLVQLGYALRFTNSGIPEDLWWYELSSSWFEDIAYPSVNDYVEYVRYYFEDPRPIQESGREGLLGYRSAHYGFILSDYGYPDLWESTWHNFIDSRAKSAIDQSLRDIAKSSFGKSYQRFAGWNLLTGSRAESGVGYPDAAEFPEIITQADIKIPESIPLSDQIRGNYINYYQLQKGIANESAIVLNFSPSPVFIQGVFSPLQNAANQTFFDAYDNVTFPIIQSGMNGLIAIVNPTDDLGSFIMSEEYAIPERATVFPNPYFAGDGNILNLYLVLETKSDLVGEVFNIRGERILTTHFDWKVYESGTHLVEIPVREGDFNGMSSGVYFIRVTGNASSHTAKFTLIK